MGSWVRLVLVLATAFTVCVPALFVVAWLNFAGGRFGWIPSLLAFGGLGVATGWLAVSKRWRTARSRTAAGLAVLGGIVGIAVAHWAPPTPDRLRHEIEGLAQPEWRLRSDRVDGSAICLDYCTSVTREYHVEAGADDVLARLQPVLASRGLEPLPAFGQDRFEFGDRGAGDIEVRIEIVRERPGPTIVHISAETN